MNSTKSCNVRKVKNTSSEVVNNNKSSNKYSLTLEDFDVNRREYGINLCGKFITYESGKVPTAFVECIYHILNFGVRLISSGQEKFTMNIDTSVDHSGMITFKFELPNTNKLPKADIFDNHAKFNGTVHNIGDVITVSDMFEATFKIESTKEKVYLHENKEPVISYQSKSKNYTLVIKFIPNKILSVFDDVLYRIEESMSNVIRLQLVILLNRYSERSEHHKLTLNDKLLSGSKWNIPKFKDALVNNTDNCTTQNIYKTVVIDYIKFQKFNENFDDFVFKFFVLAIVLGLIISLFVTTLSSYFKNE
jgi:hypothetical protein